MDLPSRLFETGGDDCELYEEDDEFVLSVEMPGSAVEDIDVAWDNGVLEVRLPVTTGATTRGTPIDVEG